MSLSLWIALGVAIALTLFCVLCMQVLARRSREIDEPVNYGRTHTGQGDEGGD